MYIKTLEIQGFKSYNEQAGIEEFSDGHNVVIGRNGSGKSNFFRAIQFVLAEKSFSNLSHKERTELLHQGAGAAVMTAHVQIVFDNSGRRFPLDSDDVVVRRTIGLKKDEYFLNSKRVQKSDVLNLLESAGFSRSNPYYIVQQGKVNSLCLMKDEQRLELLKEVAGTTVYEERRKNSETILQDTKKKREKIQETVGYIEKRLDTLKGEKEELEAFRSLDRRKRALQYTLYDLELAHATKTMETLEAEREREISVALDSGEELTQIKEKTETVQNEINSLEKQLKHSERELRVMDEDCTSLVKQKTACELRYKGLQDREVTIREHTALHEEEMEKLNKELERVTKELEEVARPAFEAAKAKCQALRVQIRDHERKEHELESKRGRKSQFANQQERDEWLTTEIENITKTLAEKSRIQEELNNTLSKQNDAKQRNEQILEELESEVIQRETQVREDEKGAMGLKKERDEASENRKACWRAQQSVEKKIVAAKQDLTRTKKSLNKSIPHNVANGLEAVEKIAKEKGLCLKTQVFGPLFELIHPESEDFQTAIEVSIGNSLTHVVVDNDETAAILMKELQSRKAGRVTFKPLEQIKQLRKSHQRRRNVDVAADDAAVHDIAGLDETEENPDAIPLITKVQYPEQVKEAVRSVLGRVLLCKNSQVASVKRKQLKVNCVTLEGEEVNRRGALTGGYHDPKASKLLAAANIRDAKDILRKLEKEREKCVVAAQQADQRVTQLIGKLSKVETESSHARAAWHNLKLDIKQRKTQMEAASKLVAGTTKQLEQNKSSQEELIANKTALETELATPMQASLSSQEQQDLDATKASLGTLRKQQLEASAAYASAKSKLNQLQTEIDQNLKVRKEDLLEDMRKGFVVTPTATTKTATKYKKVAKAKKTKRKSSKKSSKGKRRMVDDDDDGDDEEEEEEDESEAELVDVDELGDAELEEFPEGNPLEWIARKVKEAHDEFLKTDEKLKASREQHEAMEEETIKTKNRIRELFSDLEKLKAKEIETTEKLHSAEELMEKLISKRDSSRDKRMESARKIRELGSLSSEELDKVNSIRSTKTLMSEIKKVNEKLEKYSHVNKKALDQFINFSDRRETLLKRKEECDEGEKSIKDLIRHLDYQKDEDILRTFRGVAKHFREVFKELVPAGKGELVMVTRNAADGTEPGTNSSSSSQENEHLVDEFIGISPRVSFTPAGEEFRMRQLSGGQRALVALTLIFAIQRCDPAPFYLFDEIDQALDQNHRASVAAMIQKQSKRAQFITTTFKPELVQVADKLFGIQFQNKVSSMIELPREEAMEFVVSIASSENVSETPQKSSKKRRSLVSGDEDGDNDDDEDELEEKLHRTPARVSTSGKRVRAT